ncbi:hypothetical protein [Nocardia transvalensis]|uniref:hypothetical protein n=1 Tax=Nocardia transvalensis TaxID=37333 RepID=UPI001894B9E3|nr:hypothetical protein [Nocardia transvalensis]MBF6332394.1 hypothetical protein [Nocardia transvalensis]
MKTLEHCPECPNEPLRWYVTMRGRPGVPYSGITLHDVAPVAYRWCRECGYHTGEQLDIDGIVARLNDDPRLMWVKRSTPGQIDGYSTTSHAELKRSAERMARVRGSVSATYSIEYRNPAGDLIRRSATWTQGVDPETF